MTASLPALPALSSPRPFHALARNPRAARYVTFVQLGEVLAVAVLADDVLTLLGLDGVALGAPHLAPFAGSATRVFSGGGGALLAEGWGVLDVETMTPQPESVAPPRCISVTGRTLAGAPPRSRMHMWHPGDDRGYPPPLPRDLRPLAVTDAMDLLYVAGDTVARYDNQRDQVDEVLRLRKVKHVAASACGAFVARSTGTMARLHAVPSGDEVAKVARVSPDVIAAGAGGRLAVGAWDGQVTLVDPSGRRSWRVRGRVTSLAFSPDGAHLAIGCDGPLVSIVSKQEEPAAQPSPQIVALRPASAPLLALRSGRVVEAKQDSVVEHLAPLDRPQGCDSLTMAQSGPVHVRYSGDGVWWRGAHEGQTERSQGVVGHTLAPDGRHLALWVAPPDRMRPNAPRFDPVLRIIDLADGTETTHAVYGPLAFFDASSVVAFALAPDDATAPVRLDLKTGLVTPLARPDLNLPGDVAALGAACAIERVDASLTIIRLDVEREWRVNLRALGGARSYDAVRALHVGAALVASVADRMVFAHGLEDGRLLFTHELPFAPGVSALAGETLWFARQDGDLESLALVSGDRTTRRVPYA